MQARVQAAATRFDVARRNEPIVAREPHVSGQRRQRRAAGQRECEPLECGAAALGLLAGLETLCQRHQLAFEFSPHHPIGDVIEQELGAQQCVQAAEHDPAARVQAPDALGRGHAKPQGRVHRGHDGGDACPAHGRLVQGLEREIERPRRVPRALEKRHGPREAEWLVTELVAGHEQDRPGGAHGRHHFLRNAWSAARKSGVVRLTAFTSAPRRMPSSKRIPSSW